MPDTAVNRRKGTTAQHAAFTGLLAETTYDTDIKRPVVHDGATPGGFPAAMLHVANVFTQTQTIVGGNLDVEGTGEFVLNEIVLDSDGVHAGVVSLGVKSSMFTDGSVQFAQSAFFVSTVGLTTITRAGLGAAVTDALLLRNTSAAALGAQQNSPAFSVSGFGWGTTAGTSQSVRWREYLLPIQSTVPLAQLTWAYTIASGTETLGMALRDNGIFRVFFPVGGIVTAQFGLVEAGSINAWARFSGLVATGGRMDFSDGTTSGDATVARVAANHISIFRTTVAQTFSVSNTFSTTTNYEMLFAGWTANVAHIWTEKGSGGGTARDFALGADATEVIRFTSASMRMAVGKTLLIQSGANQRAGELTLVGGTVTVANTTVTATTLVLLTRKTSGGTIGTAITYTVSAGVSFTVTSDSVLDTSTFSYLLIGNPA